MPHRSYSSPAISTRLLSPRISSDTTASSTDGSITIATSRTTELQNVSVSATNTSISSSSGADRIQIRRSDGLNRDLLKVGRTGLLPVVEETPSVDITAPPEEDSGTIRIARSDGITQDIISVLRCQSEADTSRQIFASHALDGSPVTKRSLKSRNLSQSLVASSGGSGATIQVPHTKSAFGSFLSGGYKRTSDRIRAASAVNLFSSPSPPPVRSSSANEASYSVVGLTAAASAASLPCSPFIEVETPPGIELYNALSFSGQPTSAVLDSRSMLLKHVRIVHMSDTHSFLTRRMTRSLFLPHGNILVHTGNFTSEGTENEFLVFNDWLGSVSHLYHYRIIILGVRDVKLFGNNFDAARKLLSNATHVLYNDEITVLGIRFHGCSWNSTGVSSVKSGTAGGRGGVSSSGEVATGVHVLLTHGPAYDRLDCSLCARANGEMVSDDHRGNRELSETLRRVRPGLHLHGMVKEARGMLPAFGNSCMTVNSCMTDPELTVMYAPPHVIEATLLPISMKGVINWQFSIASFAD